MESNPKISIIMPTYNRAAFIMESVESVLSQTYQNWELIIVDDGSEDNTDEIISAVKDTRVKFYKAGKTGIGIRLKNFGIERSDGELIAFIDSDDMWAPQKLEKQVAVFHDYPNAGFSITGGYNFREPGKPLEYFYRQREGLKYGDIFISFFTSEASILIPTLMLRRTCLPIIHRVMESNPSTDVEYILSLALECKAVILYEPLLYRRLHENSFSTMNWERGYQEGIEVINRHKQNKNLPPAIAKDSLFRLYINFGEGYIKRRKGVKAIRQFFKAWINKPFSIVPLKKMGKAMLS